MGLLLCAQLGPCGVVVVLVVTFFVCAPLTHFTLHDRRKLEARVVGVSWFSLNLSCETLRALVSTLHLSLLSRNPQKRLLFCEALFPMLPSPNNADVVFTCRVWGFFRFYTKHMIGSFNFPAWTIGCVSAVLLMLLLGIFHKYYTTTIPSPPKKPKPKKPNLLFCEVYKVPNKTHWTKQKYKRLPVEAFFCLQVWMWFILISSKASLMQELRTNTHGTGNCGVQRRQVTLLGCFDGQTCHCVKVSWLAAGRSHRAVALLASSGALGSLAPLGSPAGMDVEYPTGRVLLFNRVSSQPSWVTSALKTRPSWSNPAGEGFIGLHALIRFRQPSGKVFCRATTTQDFMRSR